MEGYGNSLLFSLKYNKKKSDSLYIWSELWNRYKGIRLVFWHLDEVKVRPADVLQVGDLIGIGGNSGSNTTGRHLHLGYMPMKVWGRPDHAGNGTQGWVDPLGLIISLGVTI